MPVATVRNSQERIAFSCVLKGATRDRQQICLMYAATNEVIPLTNFSEDVLPSFPSWSPNGQQIAFLTFTDNEKQVDIWVMNADGSGQIKITKNLSVSGIVTLGNKSTSLIGVPSFAWSPDSTRLVFSSNVDGNMKLYIATIQDQRISQLTKGAGNDVWPSWSPDGAQIAFVSDRTGDDIYVIHRDGSGLKDLTPEEDIDTRPTWSPNGNYIAFVTDRDHNYEIYIMNADGTNPTNVTNDPATDDFPVWSPDSTRIAFVSGRGNDNSNDDIYVVMLVTNAVLRLTNSPASDNAPTWSPDGKRIAFHSWRDGTPKIYVMDADSSGLVNLTRDAPFGDHPSWISSGT
jgi:tol-pal system beta propeller repeat protein TolB